MMSFKDEENAATSMALLNERRGTSVRGLLSGLACVRCPGSYGSCW